MRDSVRVIGRDKDATKLVTVTMDPSNMTAPPRIDLVDGAGARLVGRALHDDLLSVAEQQRSAEATGAARPEGWADCITCNLLVLQWVATCAVFGDVSDACNSLYQSADAACSRCDGGGSCQYCTDACAALIC